jgi:anti-anti-sigma regulatory factor
MGSLKVDIATEGKAITVALHGSIVEGAAASLLAALNGQKNKVIEFNFKDVTIINSVGISEWISALDKIQSDKNKIFYSHCPSAVTNTMNMVQSFIGQATIKNLYVDFQCHDCDREERVLVEISEDVTKSGELVKAKTCKECSEPMEMVLSEEDVFAFISSN